MTLQQLLGIPLPIIQAPMAGVQGSALAVAVCNAGGLGSLPCATLGLDAMRQELAAIRAQTTQPFNVNFFCHTPPVPSGEREAGGHRGMFLSKDVNTQVGTLALVPQIVQAVKVPVIAAGGIADAKGVAAAMALGAAGVQIGTAYLLCAETNTSALHRAALKSD